MNASSTNPARQPVTVVIAGAAGDLGRRITEHLVKRGASVRALQRLDASEEDRERIQALGATPVGVNTSDVGAVADASAGADCVVSALSGLREVILDRQSVLLDAAVRAGTPRFISSDFCSDYTKTEPGHNRNFDLRREFMGRADRAPISVTSVMNGAFMDMLGAEMPIIQPRIHRVLYWGSADQPLDFTTRDDTAAFTAAVALDRTTPRRLRVAGDTVSARDVAHLMTELSRQTYRPLWAGTVGVLAAAARAAKTVAPQRTAVFPAWQGMQYTRDMFTGDARLRPLDNDRYPDLRWTTLRDRFSTGHLPSSQS
ncbi:NmrA family NAD(P)-binding protein [Mycolicibacterium sp.]|uniref:NmrA family NAD(P)-binding protein n=1 Tax=Mycolicibacterium sp. TaxID=2320850 RepID=UPI001A23490A|nr:NmrA family NAD(P)-binding protein [Mycolicibacterium sp.]MBJ7341536.1 NmrA family NAD(P)-binding protein [Mycolicibacterium sp.]